MPHLGAAVPTTNPGKGPMVLWIPGENPVRRKT